MSTPSAPSKGGGLDPPGTGGATPHVDPGFASEDLADKPSADHVGDDHSSTSAGSSVGSHGSGSGSDSKANGHGHGGGGPDDMSDFDTCVDAEAGAAGEAHVKAPEARSGPEGESGPRPGSEHTHAHAYYPPVCPAHAHGGHGACGCEFAMPHAVHCAGGGGGGGGGVAYPPHFAAPSADCEPTVPGGLGGEGASAVPTLVLPPPPAWVGCGCSTCTAAAMQASAAHGHSQHPHPHHGYGYGHGYGHGHARATFAPMVLRGSGFADSSDAEADAAAAAAAAATAAAAAADAADAAGEGSAGAAGAGPSPHMHMHGTGAWGGRGVLGGLLATTAAAATTVASAAGGWAKAGLRGVIGATGRTIVAVDATASDLASRLRRVTAGEEAPTAKQLIGTCAAAGAVVALVGWRLADMRRGSAGGDLDRMLADWRMHPKTRGSMVGDALRVVRAATVVSTYVATSGALVGAAVGADVYACTQCDTPVRAVAITLNVVAASCVASAIAPSRHEVRRALMRQRAAIGRRLSAVGKGAAAVVGTVVSRDRGRSSNGRGGRGYSGGGGGGGGGGAEEAATEAARVAASGWCVWKTERHAHCHHHHHCHSNCTSM